MVIDVHFRNATGDALDDGDKVRKPSLESCNAIDAMLTFNIIAPTHVRQVLLLFQDTGYRIIAVTVPVFRDQSDAIKT
jgi:hypothetical protein